MSGYSSPFSARVFTHSPYSEHLGADSRSEACLLFRCLKMCGITCLYWQTVKSFNQLLGESFFLGHPICYSHRVGKRGWKRVEAHIRFLGRAEITAVCTTTAFGMPQMGSFFTILERFELRLPHVRTPGQIK